MRRTGVGAVSLGLVLWLGGLPAVGAAADSKVVDSLAAPSSEQCSAPQPELSGGFDHFGYTFADSREPGGPAYSWVEISATGTAVALTDDASSAALPIGFSFPFYGAAQSNLYISSNGFVSFGAGSTALANTCGGAAVPNNIIALMWDDLDPGDTSDQVYYQSFTTCPVGSGACFVVQYQNYHFWPGVAGGGTVAGTFEAILFADGKILLQYADAGAEAGLEATVGIENAAGTDQLIYSCNKAILADRLAIRFSPAWRQRRDAPSTVYRYTRAQCAGEPESFYLISGFANGLHTAETKRYDALSNTWRILAPYPGGGGAGLEGAAGVCVKDAVYVVGGWATTATTDFYRYNIASNTWTALAAAPRPAVLGALGSWGGKIVLAGGTPDGMTMSSEVNIYDIATNTWTGTGAAMPAAQAGAGYAQSGRYLYVVGGYGVATPAANVDVTQRYDMQNNEWTLGPAFTSARADLALAITQDHLYAIGGDASGGGYWDSSSTVERLDYRSWPIGAWEPAPSLSLPRMALTGGFSTNSLAGGEVWAVGGTAQGMSPGPTTQYMRAQRSNHLATNASFEAGTKVPRFWRASRFGRTDGRSRLQKKFGAFSVQIAGTTAVKSMTQSIPLSGAAYDSFVLSGWSRANKPRGAGIYELSARISYADGTSGLYRMSFTKRTHNWEYKERAFVAAKDYVGVDVTLTYGKNAGTAWFDGVQLVRQ